jgi:quercetin dioxygenase-like cupin family protein
MATKVIGPQDGRSVMNGFVVYKLFAEDTGGALTIVEHVLEPGMLGAPLHTHRNEDEYSYVLRGELTALIGGEVVHAPAGTLVCKPRGVPHTFWNQGTEQTRLLEVIAPGGFEGYFDELSVVVSVCGPPDVGRIMAIAQKYGVEMDFSCLMDISQTYDVWLGGVRPSQMNQPQPQLIGEPL